MEPVNDINDPSNWTGDRSEEDKAKHIAQRAEKGYSVFDFWNFFEYHSWVMINVLEDFKTGMGHPVYGEVETMEDWVRVLTEMQDGFYANSKMSNFEIIPDSEEWADARAKWERGMQLFTTYYGSLWD